MAKKAAPNKSPDGNGALQAVRLRLQDDPKGLAHLGVAAVATLALSALLYWPLGLPGRLLTRALTMATEGNCVLTKDGILGWFCGMGVSLVAVSGAIAVAVVALVLRAQLRKQSGRAVQRAPEEFHFLERPVTATLVFAMAWSSVLFHFYGRMGIIIEGLFPALVGLLVFALAWWEPAIKSGLAPILAVRDRLPRLARLAIVIAVPVLLGYLMTGWMPYGVRDQLAALLAVFIGWLVWTASMPGTPGTPGTPRKTAALVLVLAALLFVALPVAAQGPCADGRLYMAPLVCEVAHHSGTFGGASAGIGVVTAAVVLAPASESSHGRKDKRPKTDPCADVQGRYDTARATWMVRHDTAQSMRKLVTRLEADYMARNESLFASQVASLAMQAVSIFRTALPVRAPAPTTVLQRLAGSGKDILFEGFLEHSVKAATEAGGPGAGDAIGAYDKLVAGTINTELKQHFQEAIRKKAEQTLKDAGTKVPTNSPVFRGMVNNITTEAMEAFDTFTAGVAGVAGLHGMIGKYADMKGYADKIHQLRLRLIDLEGDNDMLMDTFQGLKNDVLNCRERVAMGLEP